MKRRLGMDRTELVIVAAAVVEYGWLAFDGGRALIVGDYVTPSSGAHAGDLGPWSDLVSSIGLDPRSAFVMAAHLVLGAAGLAAAASIAVQARWSRVAVLVTAILCLWYLPFGTMLSLLQIGLLVFLRREGAK